MKEWFINNCITVNLWFFSINLEKTVTLDVRKKKNILCFFCTLYFQMCQKIVGETYIAPPHENKKQKTKKHYFSFNLRRNRNTQNQNQ